MEAVCKNHPDREGTQKCHYCKDSICTECQISIARQIYCSQKCFYLSVREFYQQKFLTPFLNFLKAKKLLTIRRLLDFVFILAIILSIKLGIDNRKLFSRLEQTQIEQTTALQQANVDSIAKEIDTLTVFSPPPSTMIIHNKFDIEGETEENHIISLSANGKLLRATVATGRYFSFQDVLASPGHNHFVVRAIDEKGHSIVLEEIKFFYGKPSLAYLARDFVRGNLAEKKIALTFDGGYLDNAAHEILEILKQDSIQATMFLTGIFLRKYSELVKRMVDEGHEIGNHTWTHPHLTTFAQDARHNTLSNVTAELVQQELLRTAELFKRITGTEMASLWRAPFGEHNPEIRLWAASVGYRHIGWTVGKNWDEGMDTMDWVADKNSSAYHSADEIADKILSFGNGTTVGCNGSIILMHLGTLRNDDYPHQKLPMIIDQLKKRGYRFVKISGMQ